MASAGAARPVPGDTLCSRSLEDEAKQEKRVKAGWVNRVGQLFAGC